MKENNYEVLVGNIGTVHTGEWEDTARQVYAEYVAISESGQGSASGEDVTLFLNGEILESHDVFGMAHIYGELE